MNYSWARLKRIKHIIEIGKFSMVGVLNTLIDFSVFFLCYSIFHINYSLSQISGYTAGTINSFILNKKWTFEDKTTGKIIFIKAIKFGTVNAISLACSIFAIKITKTYLVNSILIAKILATLCAQIINYLSYKYWVFLKD